MNRPLISVIVPVYKVEAYLKECIDSIRNQTYRNLEIILVDDGSPDKSGEMCDALAKEDPRIRVIHKENGGLSSARNAGLDVANGEYVSFVDSDDWISLDMYQRLMDLMQQHHAQIAAGGMQDNTGKHFNPGYPKNANVEVFSRLDALREITINKKITNSACDKLWKKTIFDTIRFPVGEYYEDFKTSYKCIDLVDTVVYDPHPVYIYRMTDSSITRGQFHPRMFEDAYAAKSRADYYQEKYPMLYGYAYASYIWICLFKIWQSRGTSSCDEKRNALISEMKGSIPTPAVNLLNLQTKIKLYALRIGTPVFYFIMKLIEFVKK